MDDQTWKSSQLKDMEQMKIMNFEELHRDFPPMREQTIETLTENVIANSSRCLDPRFRFIFGRLIHHLHTFAKEVNLQTDEWMAGVEFLTEIGQSCCEERQETILLSDVLGLSALVDALSNPRPPNCTPSTILGPFHRKDASYYPNGSSINPRNIGNKLLVSGRVMDSKGNPIKGAQLDVWEADPEGLYDVQHLDRAVPDNRGIFTTDADGGYNFEAIVPVAYNIPVDGLVGKVMRKLRHHCFRPSHVHFKIDAEGYAPLVTALYIKGDPFIASDAVYGVKDQLIVEPVKHEPNTELNPDQDAKPWWTLSYDFVLATVEEVAQVQK